MVLSREKLEGSQKRRKYRRLESGDEGGSSSAGRREGGLGQQEGEFSRVSFRERRTVMEEGKRGD